MRRTGKTRNWIMTTNVSNKLACVIAFAVVMLAAQKASSATYSYLEFNPTNTLADSSGNGRVMGTPPTGVTFADAAAVFDGTQGHWIMQNPDNVDNKQTFGSTQGLTVEAFVQTTSAKGTLCELHDYVWKRAGAFNFMAGSGTDNLTGSYDGTGSGTLHYETASFPTDGEWHHVALAIQRDAANTNNIVRLYLDYVQVGVDTRSSATANTFPVHWLSVGARQGGSLQFTGKIDDFRITAAPAVLTPAQFIQERTSPILKGTIILVK